MLEKNRKRADRRKHAAKDKRKRLYAKATKDSEGGWTHHLGRTSEELRFDGRVPQREVHDLYQQRDIIPAESGDTTPRDSSCDLGGASTGHEDGEGGTSSDCS